MGLFRKLLPAWRLISARLGSRGTLNLGRKTRLESPLTLNGRGCVTIGERTALGYSLAPRIGNGANLLQAREKGSRIDIGPNCAFSNNVTIVAIMQVTVGEDCLVGDQVMIVDSDFHGIAPHLRRTPGESAPVHIGRNVWLGSRAMVLKGVTIGDHAVVAAGSLVTKDVPAGTLVAGVPAKVIRRVDTQG